MSQVEALARKVGFGFRPDEKVPTDPVQWIDEQLQLSRSFQGISSLSDSGKVGEWPQKFLKNVEERTDLDMMRLAFIIGRSTLEIRFGNGCFISGSITSMCQVKSMI